MGASERKKRESNPQALSDAAFQEQGTRQCALFFHQVGTVSIDEATAKDLPDIILSDLIKITVSLGTI